MPDFINRLSKFPIATAEEAEKKAIENLVTRILKAKGANTAADVSTEEREIDDHVYRLYGLTKDEIKIVEEEASK